MSPRLSRIAVLNAVAPLAGVTPRRFTRPFGDGQGHKACPLLGALAVTAEGSAVHLTPLTFDVVLGLVVCKP